MRLVLIAPFERGGAFGGSQRATTVAERLEERGASVDWVTIEPRVPGRGERVAGALVREPALVRYARGGGEPPRGDWDAAIAAHSYMTPHLGRLGIPCAVDFHNLEWRHLLDAAAAAGPVRGAHLRLQARRMRRHEREVLRAHPLSLFASREELDWADGPGLRLLVPNLLPRAAAEAAEEARRARPAARRDDLLLYVGKLTFPPNAASLLRFLHTAWPAVLARNPRATLRVIGRCDAALRSRIAAHPRVEALGFVDDVGPSLSEAGAAVLPFDGRAGSSLRVLLYGLAGVPVIGPSTAFRGVERSGGIVVDSPVEWAAGVERALSGGGGESRMRAAAAALHADPAPWDALYAALLALAGRSQERSVAA
jgi:hypothetical protein